MFVAIAKFVKKIKAMETQEKIVILKDVLQEKMKTFNKIRFGITEEIKNRELETSFDTKTKSSINISHLGTSFFGRRRR